MIDQKKINKAQFVNMFNQFEKDILNEYYASMKKLESR